MNYTKTIRSFCLQNTGKIFDAQQMGNDYFSMVPYKTLLKVLTRLETEGILSPVSKGVYIINSDNAINMIYYQQGLASVCAMSMKAKLALKML